MSAVPRTVDLRGVSAEDADLSAAVAHVRAGGLLVYPTETVYGLGGLCNTEAVARVRGLKGREPDKPLIALVRRPEDVEELVWTPESRELAEIFWPGAVTLVLPDPRRTFPDGVRSVDGAVAVRMSPHPLVVRLLDELREPLTSTSANLPSEEPAHSGTAAADAARSLGVAGDVLVLDAGTLPASGPSTVVDCTVSPPVVIRQGTVPIDRLRCALPGIHAR